MIENKEKALSIIVLADRIKATVLGKNPIFFVPIIPY
jgi:hypothetical protein